MKSDEELKRDVQDAIKWEPRLQASRVEVAVQASVVTLTGTLNSYPKKLEAENAAKNVAGVKAVVEHIAIEFERMDKKNDGEIAIEAVIALKRDQDVPDEKVQIRVEEGKVTLEGELPWNYQREAAIKAVDNLIGVRAVINNITISSAVHDALEKKLIEHALAGNWSIDNKGIQVAVKGNRIILTGLVNSIYAKDAAERIAWNAPGVSSVENELCIECEN
ncbi:MAG: BON domain-containing protein [Bacteroidota bacterium]